ncbi:MAG: ATPase [Litoreibacter sp.]
MIYSSAKDFLDDPAKKLLFFGMSGLGKSYIANTLRETGAWFHYSVDYRIGTRYMGEHIVDNFKYQAMRNPFLADLLRSDSIYIASNITFENLTPLSTYLGKPGNPELGGLPFDEYLHRQTQHHTAEVAALLDTQHFMKRARQLYSYEHFVCDTGGSICEVVDPEDPKDPVLTQLSQTQLMVWIEGDDNHTAELVRRFDKAPKPMYYQSGFITASWSEYLSINNIVENEVDPNDFIRWTYLRAMNHRQPRYASMAKNWGIKIAASDLSLARDESDVIELIAQALGTASS